MEMLQSIIGFLPGMTWLYAKKEIQKSIKTCQDYLMGQNQNKLYLAEARQESTQKSEEIRVT
jgi:hypothetical protein